MENKVLGCTETCPLCNRICEGDLNHKHEHNASIYGHGIINIHNSDDSKTNREERYNWVNKISEKVGYYRKMRLKFCHEEFKYDQKILVKNEKINYDDYKKNMISNWNRLKSKSITNKKKTFIHLSSIFWKKFKDHHCNKIHNYVSYKIPYYFIFFTEESVFLKTINNSSRYMDKAIDIFEKINTHHKKNIIDIYFLWFRDQITSYKENKYINKNKNKETKHNYIKDPNTFHRDTIKNDKNIKTDFRFFLNKIKEGINKYPNYNHIILFVIFNLNNIKINDIKEKIFHVILNSKNQYRIIIFYKFFSEQFQEKLEKILGHSVEFIKLRFFYFCEIHKKIFSLLNKN